MLRISGGIRELILLEWQQFHKAILKYGGAAILFFICELQPVTIRLF
jgi:hypothetical protein